MSVEPWNLPTAEEEFDDLASMGVDLAQPTSDAHLDAMASQLLGAMGRRDREIARLTEARDAELARIAMRYDTQIEREQKARAYLEGVVEQIAARVDYGPKKKSRRVGYGVYGKKDFGERIEILNQEAAVLFAITHAPGAVKIKESVTQKDIAPVVLDYIKTHEGEIPEGFEHHGERTEYYAKPELD